MTVVTRGAVTDEIPARERPEFGPILIIARKVLRESVRDRWFWLYSAGFAVLAGALAVVAVPDPDVVGSGGFGRTAASLVTLVQLMVTVMALTLGARSLSGERETGTLRFLLSHPVSRTEVFAGTVLGLSAVLLAALAAGFGSAAVFSALRDSPADTATWWRLAGLSWLLAMVMLAIGLVIAVSTRRSGVAMGISLFVWLVLVFLGDLGLMGTVVSTGLPVSALFVSVMANPVESFRLASIVSLDGSLDALGPAGIYAVDTYGESIGMIAVGTLVFWFLVATFLGWFIFKRRAEV